MTTFNQNLPEPIAKPLSKKFHVNGPRDVEILTRHLNIPTSTGRNPHRVKGSPYTVPAIISLVVMVVGILTGLTQIPQLREFLSLLFG